MVAIISEHWNFYVFFKSEINKLVTVMNFKQNKQSAVRLLIS